MNWSDETAVKLASALRGAMSYGHFTDERMAKIALSSITLQDLMQVDEVRELVGAGKWMLSRIPEPNAIGLDEAGYPEYSNDTDHSNAWERHELIKALTPFMEAK